MLRHTGTKRTFRHNLQLATFLSLAAGFVNAAGLMAFAVLTTNITGHAATFAADLTLNDMRAVKMAGMGLLLFLTGAFFSGIYTRSMGRHKRFVYTVPLLIVLSILAYVALYGYTYDGSMEKRGHFAGSLLFAMGIQNALVSVVSHSVVRTTHLTGIMTDFGIALADAVRSRLKLGKLLRQRLILHINIIIPFLMGGVLGAFSFAEFRYYAFFIPAGIVMFVIFFDAFRVRVLLIRHHFFLRNRRRVAARRTRIQRKASGKK